jgi:hypothetical protein
MNWEHGWVGIDLLPLENATEIRHAFYYELRFRCDGSSAFLFSSALSLSTTTSVCAERVGRGELRENQKTFKRRNNNFQMFLPGEIPNG